MFDNILAVTKKVELQTRSKAHCKIVFVLALGSASLSISSSAYSDNGFLFRVDTRSPDQIWGPAGRPTQGQGFRAPGNNQNLIAHIKGTTCKQGDATTWFISVSADPTWAASYARRLYANTGGQPVYLYIIRQTADFYDAATTLRAFFPRHAANEIITAQMQREWITFTPVTPQLIYGVRTFNTPDPNVAPAIMLNPNFIDPGPVVNHLPMPLGTPAQAPVGACLATTVRISLMVISRHFGESYPYGG